MEARDLELLEKYLPQDLELKTLWDEHIIYKKKLEKLESKIVRTPSEDKTLKEIKKQKLEGKTRLHGILDRYRNAEG
ncbi:DUF465 domain-containing protein [Desulfovibrio subterraneus]|jgi:hypothetical protein|uniref:DUF465 domain-containing protein n=1 Tax=Desulfovibrio subterraneus TaxID=2718620 RepID=A0A7J0BJ56_9BACT|nr:DUF465 domain-containing protein [Desulfovibrio subterraneus]WBF67883.1 DUF465 domain-containing protein [Desulfovibrio subterraneus]GFM33747.1 hypothetical protein DSM101010T_21120 [Desulfovibrio subterraneus]